jgi:hypothetical protein
MMRALNGGATNTNLIVFDFRRAGIKSTIYHTLTITPPFLDFRRAGIKPTIYHTLTITPPSLDFRRAGIQPTIYHILTITPPRWLDPFVFYVFIII